MPLPELEYISMVEATVKFKDVTVEHLRGLIENQLISAYVRESGSKYRYARLKAPRWNGHNLEFCAAEILGEDGKLPKFLKIDEDGNPYHEILYVAGRAYDMIFVKTCDLKALSQQMTYDSTKIQESEAELCNRLKIEGKTDKEIAKELKKHFPSIYPSRIGRLITQEEGITVTSDAYRKRGKKLLK